MEKRIIQVEEKVPVKLLIPLSIQHMFAMFGASVLVPFLFGISPAIVLFMNGIGTLLFIAITKGKAPAYLGSSFAFLAPASIVIQNFGYEYALGGFVAVGFCGCILALIIYKFGTDWINIVLPPAAMGPVVALIGLELSSNAASNAGLLDETIDPRKIIVFLVTLGVAVFGSILFRKFLAVIPILIAVLAGYAAAIICGIVDFEEVAAAKLIAVPHFTSPKFDPSGHSGHHFRTYWTSGSYQQDRRKRPVKRSGTSQIFICRQFFHYAFRFDRFCADNHLWREYWGNGSNWCIQCPRYCRCSHSFYRMFLCRKAVCPYQHHSGPCYRWYFIFALRHDRNFRSAHSGRL